MASDTTSGSKTVKISGKEVMLKNKSYFKKSTGDEAGCAAKKGVLTSVNRGKVYFNAWSMDVKFEGENVVRHFDITTHNHASLPGNSPTWPFIDSAAFAGTGPCKDVAKGLNDHCVDKIVPTSGGEVNRVKSIEAMCADPNCEAALKCVLTQKEPSNCCPQPQPSPPTQTPHHIVPASQFKKVGSQGGGPLITDSDGNDKYSYNKAPCICEKGTGHSTGIHGQIHRETNTLTVEHPSVKPHVPGRRISPDARWKVSDAEQVGAAATAKVTKCDPKCIEQQVRQGHEKMGIKPSDDIRPTTAGKVVKPESDFVA
jgi:hypothetical protein